MAQTGYTPILLYSSSTTTNAPAAGNLTNSTFGSELAINIADGKLFYKDSSNNVQVIAWKTTPTTAGGTGLTSYTAGDLTYYASGTTLTKLTIGSSGQVLTSSGTAPQWTTLSGVAVTTFSAGTTGFTPNSATSGAVTLAGTLITSNGGTGLSSYTAGDLIYYASGTAFTKLAIGASGRFLSSTGTAPQWNAPAALTETDDTNVTLTLGGSPSTALLNAVSMTLGWTGQLAVTRGGTGLSTVAQGDILYGSAANTLAALTKNTTATRYLANTGTNNNPAWAQIDLSNGVTGTLPVGNGGTGATSFTAGRVLFGNSTSAINTSANLFWDNSNNRLGILTTGPDSPLDVRGTARLGSNGLGGGVAANGVLIQSVSDFTKVLWQFYGASTNPWIGVNGASDSTKLLIGRDATTWANFSAAGDLSIGNSTNTASEKLDVTGNIRTTGNLIIATSGKGIDFSVTPGTGTSELLNDYEEGTWTATLKGSVSDPTTPVTVTGLYTRIGRLVTITAAFDNVNTTGASGDVTVTGIPFNNSTPHTRVIGTAGGLYNFTIANKYITCGMNENATAIYFSDEASGTAGTNLQHSAGITRYIRFSLTYYAS